MALSINLKEEVEIGGSPGNFSDSDLKYQHLLGGFVGRKLFTIAYQAKGNNFVLKTKGSLDLKGEHLSAPKPKTSSQVKLITNIEGRNIETRFDNKGTIRLWSNLATLKLRVPANVTGKIKTDSKFENLSYALGIDWSIKGLDVASQVHVKNGHLFLGEKLVYSKNDYQVGLIQKMSLATFLWSRMHLFGTYKRGKYNFYFEHIMKGNGLTRMESWGKTVLAATLKSSKNQYVLKSTYRHDKGKEPLRVTLGTVAKIDNNNSLRAKLNNKAKLTCTWKRKFNENVTLSVGSQVQLTNPSSFTTHKAIPIPIGFNLKFAQ